MNKGVETAEHPPFVFWACFWGVGLAFALAASGYDILRPHIAVPPGRDFSNLYTAGKLALDGEAWMAFDPNIFRLALREYIGTLTLQNYSYPPHALFLAVPFALLPYGISFALWTVVSLALFLWAARSYVRFPLILAILTPAAALNVWNGHYGLILGALWLIYFRLLTKRPVAAGWTAALLSIKPHMGLFIGLTALTSRRTFITAAIGVLVLIILSGVVFGFACWFGFIDTTTATQTEILTRQSGEFYFRLMPSAYTAYGRGWVAIAVQAIFASAAIILLIRRRRIDPFSLATATFIVVPYVFVYDMTVACLGFALLIWRDWKVLTIEERTILTLAFMTPNINIVASPLVPPILLAALWVQLRKEATW
jgi:alpha-1,2-mannosyltransferase